MFHLVYHEALGRAASISPRIDPNSVTRAAYEDDRPGGIVAVIDHVAAPGRETRAEWRQPTASTRLSFARFRASGFVSTVSRSSPQFGRRSLGEVFEPSIAAGPTASSIGSASCARGGRSMAAIKTAPRGRRRRLYRQNRRPAASHDARLRTIDDGAYIRQAAESGGQASSASAPYHYRYDSAMRRHVPGSAFRRARRNRSSTSQ